MASLHARSAAPPHRPRPARQAAQRRPGAAASRPRCSCGGGCPACRPAKGSGASRWQLGATGSAQEQAADRLAQQATGGPGPASAASGSGAAGPAPPGFDAGLAGLPAGEPLAESTRQRHEAAFGRPLPGVRLHRGAQADMLARSVNARALVAGPHVVLAQGQGLPHTAPGPWVLAHELAHTALGHGQGQQVWRSVETSSNPQGERGQAPLRGEAPPGTGRSGGQGGGADGAGGAGGTGGSGGLPGPEPCAPPTEMGCTEATDSPATEDATVLFDVASAALRPGVADALALLGTLWRLAGGPVRLRLDGYASVEGPCVYNWDLSCRRAQAVAAGLQQSLLPPMAGVEPASLDVLAQGESNAAGPMLAANRRVTLQLLPQPAAPTPEPAPEPPADCSPSGAQATATGCTPNPSGSHLPDVGGTHTESHAFAPCLLTQAEVAASPDWCVDAQQAHGGEVCYRRIPTTAGDPGDQYCYSQNCCHNSVDAVSVVSPDSPGSNACCAPTYLQYPGHLWFDVLPEFIDDPERVTRDILGL